MYNEVTANVQSIENILDLPLHIPNYQRAYQWREQNTLQLLEDIKSSYNQNFNKYQIGTLILHKVHKESDSIMNIVDGQQRITTIQLLYCIQKHQKSINIPKNICNLKYIHEDSFKHIKINYDVVEEFINELGSEDVEKMYKYVLQKCNMVVVTLLEISEAFQLFDSQNSRGKSLEPHDLLKAFHIRSMRESSIDSKIEVDLKWQQSNNLKDV